MSAYMVSDEHINVMVWKAGQRAYQHDTLFTFTRDDGRVLRITSTADARELGQLLHDANLASVLARYGEWDDLEPYRYARPTFQTWSALEVIGALSCYEYQACEVPDWRGSEAYRLCRDLESHYICLAQRESGVRRWSILPGDRPVELSPVA